MDEFFDQVDRKDSDQHGKRNLAFYANGSTAGSTAIPF